MNTRADLWKRIACRPVSERGRNFIEVLEVRVAPAGIINFNGSGSVVVDLAAHTITDSSAPGGPVDFSGADLIQIGAGAALTIKGTAGADGLSFLPTGATSGSVSVGGANPLVQFTGIAGAFTIDPLGGSDLVTIVGDSGNNAIVATGGATPTVQVGGTKAVTLVAGNTEALVVEGLSGDDSLNVDSGAGAFAVPITYDGGDGFDTLTTQGGSATLNLYEMGMTRDAGTRTLVIGGVTEKITFTGLEPVVDLVAGVLTINGTNLSNSITYRQGTAATNGLIAVDDSETIEFRNKTEVIINALEGDDVIHLSNSATPTGLTKITVNGDLGDDVIATDGLFAVPVVFNGGFGNDLLDATSSTGGATLSGGDGNDSLFGGIGNDALDGGAGDDTFAGNGGTDNVGGGLGSSVGDTILLSGTTGNDVFAMARDATGRLLATINGITTTFGDFLSGPIANSGIEQIAVHGFAGVDGLAITNTNGAIPIPINFDGGDNADRLTLTGGTATSDTYNPGPNSGEGLSTIVIGGVTQVVTFSGVSNVFDLVTGPLVINANDESNAISYAVGRNDANTLDDTTRGRVSIDAQAFIHFSNKPTVTINALGGEDVVSLNNSSTPTGLTNITVNGDVGADLIGTNGAIPVPLTLSGGAGNDLLDASSSTGGATLNGSDGNDSLFGGIGNDSMDGGAGDDTFAGNGGTDSVGGGSGASVGDTLLLSGTTGADVFAMSMDPTGRLLVTINGLTTTYGNFLSGPIASSGIEQIAVNGLAGADGLSITNSNGASPIPINFDGGDNADRLTLTGGTATSSGYNPGPNPGEGFSTIVIGGVTQIVTFSSVDAVIDLVAGPLVINANDANNAISYAVGRNDANTANDATRGKVSIDALAYINFSNKTALTLNALGGDDSINLNNPSTPTGLTSITVNGGSASASDRLVISGTAGNDLFTFTGTSATDGTVAVSGAPQVAFSNARNLVIDGLAGADTFRLASQKGAVEIRGGDDSDTVDFTGASTGVTLDLDLLNALQRVNVTGESIRLGDGIENFIGTSFNDTILIKAASFPRTLNGASQAAGQPGDALVVTGDDAMVNILPTDANTGTVRTIGFADVSYDEFETQLLIGVPIVPPGLGTVFNNDAFSTANIYDPTLFFNGTKPAPGKGPAAVATGDLNGDSYVDLVVVNAKTANLSVLINKGDGTFFDPVNLSAGSTAPQDLVIGDFDGDTRLDAVVTFPKAGKFAFLKGDGAGSFAAAELTATPKFKPFAIAAADLDGDSDLDLAVTSRDTHAIAIMLGNGTGSFTVGTPIKALGKQPVDIVIADFNGDGDLDLATANAGSNNINLFRGNGVGDVADPVRFAAGARPSGLAAGDLDNDGDIDLAVSNSVSRFVSVLLSAGNVTESSQFAPQIRVALPGQHNASAIAIADFDGDGLRDIGLGNALGTKFTVLRGLGSAIYSQPYDFDLGKDTKPNKTTAIALADLNNDGLLDVIATSVASSDLRTLLRRF